MLVLTSLLACSSLSLVDYEFGGTGKATIPALATPTLLDGEPLSGLLDAQERADSDNVSPGDIAEGHIVSLDLSVLQVAGDLSFLDELRIYVEAPGEDRLLVASATDQLVGRGPAGFDLEDVDLGAHLSTGEASFVTEAWGETPVVDTTLELQWRVSVGVTAQGLFGG